MRPRHLLPVASLLVACAHRDPYATTDSTLGLDRVNELEIRPFVGHGALAMIGGVAIIGAVSYVFVVGEVKRLEI